MQHLLEFPARGLWQPGQIKIAWVADSRPIIPEIEALIDATWAAEIKRPGIHLFDGPMCRFEGATVSSDSIQLSLSPTTYRPFLGTNLHHPELAKKYGPNALVNPVGLSGLLLSSDGFAMMGRRNEKVAYFPGRVHPFAGCLEPNEPLDVFDDIRREFREELSLENADIESIVCLGIARDCSLGQPELIFLARSKRSRQQIESRLDPGEHSGVWAIESNADSAGRALAGDEKFTPVGIAAILLWGGVEFGQTWFGQQAARFI